jgi:hypothetical protein
LNTLKSFETCVHLFTIIKDIIEPLKEHPDYGTEIWRVTHKIDDGFKALQEFYMKLVEEQ